MQHAPVDIAALVERNPISRFQLGVFLLCGLCILMDGFDVQAMGYVAPAIIQEWHVSRASLGPVFGAGLFGMLAGSLLFSVLADKLGRRPVLIGATLFFSVCMLLTPSCSTLEQLQWLRFITGIGLGAIMPNVMALAGEYSPRRRRVTLMMLVSCGFTVGAVVGGLVAAAVMPLYGWHAVFYIGGALPLLIGLLMLWMLPESMQFVILSGKRIERVAQWLRRIDPAFTPQHGQGYQVQEQGGQRGSVAALFKAGRARTTLLLWLVNFLNLLNLYFLSNWLPTILKDAGLSTSTAVLAGTILPVGGTIGTLAMGQLIDRSGFRRVLIPSFLVAAVAIALIGQSQQLLALLCAAILVAGFCVVGGQPAVNALAANYYPTTLRSTGIGWSLGVGRIGSIIGPLLGGELLRMNWPNSTIFLIAAVPALLSALMLWLMATPAGQD
ncbi:MFS transporter [Duganella qianjiadongensis]|uniref:MFS transporter n=1 Tax=Duganella qianjiadongensis TaxID=2692176 RepID=A0ABW9VS97_9BURK|nr:MFS transporter [Duganella qianjiadongensis]MYM41875.1 MFS transporter [Duganella qianjiadongensis]